MKILKKEIWWIFDCKSCKSKCQADPKDVTSRENIDREGDCVGHICVVECGVCGAQHDVPEEKLTPKIEKIAAKKRLTRRQ